MSDTPISHSNPRVASCVLAGLGVIALSALGSAIFYQFTGQDATVGRIGNNIFHYLAVRYEVPHLAVLAALFFSLAVLLFRLEKGSAPEVEQAGSPPGWRWLRPVLILFPLVACAAGTYFVYHNFDLCIDEYLPRFQARLFARGRIFADVPEQWRSFAPAMTTTFLVYDPVAGHWTQGFLPVYAALRAALSFVNLDAITNALLAALSVYALFRTADNLWPAQPKYGIGCALLLATSTQFLIMAMTSYAWPAHLCFNLVFLWFYTTREGRLPWVAPWVGLLAIGLHQPHVHALFAAPFVLRLAMEHRWRMFGYYSGVYVLAGAVWWGWLVQTRFQVPGGNLSGTFGMPPPWMAMVHLSNAGLLLAWNTPILGVLAGLAIWRWRRLPSFAHDLAFSAAITLGFYLFFPHNQGHGWGYRFAHGLLGNFVLLAAYGWGFAAETMNARVLHRLACGSLAFTLLWQLPARLWEVETFVGPYAKSWRFIASQPADVVVVDAATGWYASDLVRNDPFFEATPKVMFMHRLNSPALVDELRRRGTIRVVSNEHLEPLGVPLGIPRQPMPVQHAPAPQPVSAKK